MTNQKRITLFFVGVICVLLCFVPDPIPFVDEIAVGGGGAIALIKVIASFLKNDKNN